LKNQQISVFTFMHCAETREQAIASRAAESALWFLNAAPSVFQVPRSLWIDAIRGDLQSSDPRATRSVAQCDITGEIDLDDPNPVIRLLNRQLLGEEIDPVEAFEVLEPLESVVIGDIASCRAKIAGYRAIGVDRLMCLMSFGRIAQQDALVEPAAHGRAADPGVLARQEEERVRRDHRRLVPKTFESVKNWGRWGADDQMRRAALHHARAARARARAPCATASR
jgi:hypothetical protein